MHGSSRVGELSLLAKLVDSLRQHSVEQDVFVALMACGYIHISNKTERQLFGFFLAFLYIISASQSHDRETIVTIPSVFINVTETELALER